MTQDQTDISVVADSPKDAPAEPMPMHRRWGWIAISTIHMLYALLIVAGIAITWFQVRAEGLPARSRLLSIRSLDDLKYLIAFRQTDWLGYAAGALCAAAYVAIRKSSWKATLAVTILAAIFIGGQFALLCHYHYGTGLQMHARDTLPPLQPGGRRFRIMSISTAVLAVPWLLTIIGLSTVRPARERDVPQE